MLRRASMLAAVDHPHVVVPTKVDTDGAGLATFVMPAACGDVLSDAASGTLAGEADAVAAECVLALNHLHELGLSAGASPPTASVSRATRAACGRALKRTRARPSKRRPGTRRAQPRGDAPRALVAMTPRVAGRIGVHRSDPGGHDARSAPHPLHARAVGGRAFPTEGPRSAARSERPRSLRRTRAVLNRVLAAVDAASAPSGDRRVVVAGPRGAGKSALLREASWALEAAGVRVRRARCGTTGASLLGTLFPRSEGRFAGVVDVCADTRDGPLVLAIDDVHAAGDADVDALRRLIDAASAAPVVLLLAASDAEAGGATAGAALVAAAPTERLRGLTARDVSEWIAATGLGMRSVADLAGHFDEGHGFLPGTVAPAPSRRLHGTGRALRGDAAAADGRRAPRRARAAATAPRTGHPLRPTTRACVSSRASRKRSPPRPPATTCCASPFR
jgi:hypothetical protein